jgi:hypothetical protein
MGSNRKPTSDKQLADLNTWQHKTGTLIFGADNGSRGTDNDGKYEAPKANPSVETSSGCAADGED